MPGQVQRQKIRLSERLERKGPRKLLAIDGGGIRGVLALQILAKIEAILRGESKNADYRLADYFDYVAGTSTGAIIAAGISLGMSVDEILEFYLKNGAAMFAKAGLLQRPLYKYKNKPLAEELQTAFGSSTTLGSEEIETLLLVIMRNATTDSPWPISNNPFAKYNDSAHPTSNLNFPLWQLVRASTAAPTFFAPEVITISGKPFIFVDGGVTTYNNPAFQMFLMATVDRYWVKAPPKKRGWETGAGKMLTVSVGTGTSAGPNYSLRPEEMHILFNAKSIPSALMYAALNEQDFLCRIFGECVAGPLLDREVDAMTPSTGPLREKLFRYARYNAELTPEGLRDLGCGDIKPEHVQKMDSVEFIPALKRVGKAAADRYVDRAHFNFAVFRP
jgi:uncharacterized protein